jgi:hypothetical protein
VLEVNLLAQGLDLKISKCAKNKTVQDIGKNVSIILQALPDEQGHQEEPEQEEEEAEL